VGPPWSGFLRYTYFPSKKFSAGRETLKFDNTAINYHSFVRIGYIWALKTYFLQGTRITDLETTAVNE